MVLILLLYYSFFLLFLRDSVSNEALDTSHHLVKEAILFSFFCLFSCFFLCSLSFFFLFQLFLAFSFFLCLLFSAAVRTTPVPTVSFGFLGVLCWSLIGVVSVLLKRSVPISLPAQFMLPLANNPNTVFIIPL